MPVSRFEQLTAPFRSETPSPSISWGWSTAGLMLVLSVWLAMAAPQTRPSASPGSPSASPRASLASPTVSAAPAQSSLPPASPAQNSASPAAAVTSDPGLPATQATRAAVPVAPMAAGLKLVPAPLPGLKPAVQSKRNRLRRKPLRSRLSLPTRPTAPRRAATYYRTRRRSPQ